jgi:plasmid stabilization system protein ParE
VFQLIFTREAQADVMDAARYYDGKLKGLGQRFKKEVMNQLASLKQNPHTRTVRYDAIRLAVIKKFPYSIHYSIFENRLVIFML